jgi:hypothetical protein
MVEGTSPCSRQLGSLDDAVVCQSVVQDQIAGTDQVPNDGFVGGMSAREGNDVFDTEEL